MPHSPTPPEGRNPPDNIWPTVVERRTSRSCDAEERREIPVREKTTNEPTEIAK